MKRVQQTLAPFLNNGAPAQTIMPGLRELDFGDWTGLNWRGRERKVHPRADEWLDHIERGAAQRRNRPVPRPRRAVPARNHQEASRRNLAVFCHGGVVRMILAILLDLPLRKTNPFEIEYASVTRVVLHPHMAEIELLNFTPWRNVPASGHHFK